MEFLRSIARRHRALKEKIHSTRIPLSKNGVRFMKVVYFSIPIISGYYLMQWATSDVGDTERAIRARKAASLSDIDRQNAARFEALQNAATDSSGSGSWAKEMDALRYPGRARGEAAR